MVDNHQKASKTIKEKLETKTSANKSSNLIWAYRYTQFFMLSLNLASELDFRASRISL